MKCEHLIWLIGALFIPHSESFPLNKENKYWIKEWAAKRFSVDLFVPRYDSFPMNPEKKTLIPYIYNASNEGPFLKFSEKNYKFKIPTVTGS